MADDGRDGWFGYDDDDDREERGWWTDDRPRDRSRAVAGRDDAVVPGYRPDRSRGGFGVDARFRGGYREQERYEGGELGSSDWSERSFGRNGSAGFGDRASHGAARAGSGDEYRNQFGDDGRGGYDWATRGSRFRSNAFGDFNRGDYMRPTNGESYSDAANSAGAGQRGGSRGAPDGYGSGGGRGSAARGDQGERPLGYEPGNESGAFGPVQQPRQSFRGRGPKNYQRSDDRIREDISERLLDDHDVDASDVEVAVAGGVVTLTGSVAERSMKRRAEDVAERVSGVKDVHNNIRIPRADGRGGNVPNGESQGR